MTALYSSGSGHDAVIRSVVFKDLVASLREVEEVLVVLRVSNVLDVSGHFLEEQDLNNVVH